MMIYIFYLFSTGVPEATSTCKIVEIEIPSTNFWIRQKKGNYFAMISIDRIKRSFKLNKQQKKTL